MADIQSAMAEIRREKKRQKKKKKSQGKNIMFKSAMGGHNQEKQPRKYTINLG